MPKSIQPADRRPLVYGVFVLLILFAASYLFWPRSPRPDSLVLTPDSVRTDSAAASIEGEPTEAEASDVETVAVDDANEIAEETSISNEPPAVKTKTTPPVNRQTAEATSTGPAGSGNWVLNVGAYSKESSARARAAEISRQGMSGHVRQIVSDGKTLWRVRVGYFASKGKADEYGKWMKSTHDIESWAGSR
jgi:cell division septation protein DedD